MLVTVVSLVALVAGAFALGRTLFGTASAYLGAFFVGRTMETLLFDVRPDDPLSFIAMPALLIAVTAVACLVPVRRALAIDPAQALRSQ